MQCATQRPVFEAAHVKTVGIRGDNEVGIMKLDKAESLATLTEEPFSTSECDGKHSNLIPKHALLSSLPWDAADPHTGHQ